jgi:hypothetical protein
MRSDWELQHKSDDPSRALFPQNSVTGDLPRFVKASYRQHSAYLASGIREHASGNQVYIGANVLKEVPDGTTVTVLETSQLNYYRYIITTLPSQKIALAGLVIALGGLLIDGGFELGKIKPLWHVNESGMFTLIAVGIAAKIIGLFLVFWKGVIQK